MQIRKGRRNTTPRTKKKENLIYQLKILHMLILKYPSIPPHSQTPTNSKGRPRPKDLYHCERPDPLDWLHSHKRPFIDPSIIQHLLNLFIQPPQTRKEYIQCKNIWSGISSSLKHKLHRFSITMTLAWSISWVGVFHRIIFTWKKLL